MSESKAVPVSNTAVTADRPIRRRRGARLVAVFAVAVILGGYLWHNREPTAAEIQAEVKHLSIGVEVGNSMWPFWLRQNVPGWIETFCDRQRHVTALFAGDGRATRAHLARWSKLHRLQRLHIDGASITDDDLRYVSDFPELMSLDLQDTPVSDAGLVHLSNLRDLDRLCLAGTQVRGPGLVHLRDLPQLAKVQFGNTPLDDAGLAEVGELKYLDWVFLNGTRITDAGLVHLRDLPRLEKLDLRSTAVTDAGLMSLSGLRRPVLLRLAGTQVTDAGVAEFQRLNPECDIER